MDNSKSSILKTTREAKGLTLEIVHEATKIPLDALRAIEEGYSVRILSPFYYRGFIKIYSEFLGLDAAEMYKHYELDQPVKQAVPAAGTVKPNIKPAVKPAVKIPAKSSPKMIHKAVKEAPGPNLFLEQTQESLSNILKPKNLALMVKFLGFWVVVILLMKIGGCIASHMTSKKITHPKHLVLAAEKKIAHKVHAEEKAKTVPEEEIKPEIIPAPSTAQDEVQKVEVAVRATRNTWLQVKEDGKVVFQMTLSKGSMESWSADNRIELSGRNVEQLDMEVNGKHIGSLGGGQRRIRKVLITKDGLTVKR